jgi:hypothetical protein
LKMTTIHQGHNEKKKKRRKKNKEGRDTGKTIDANDGKFAVTMLVNEERMRAAVRLASSFSPSSESDEDGAEKRAPSEWIREGTEDERTMREIHT